VLCLTVAPLPQGKSPFAVQLNNNNYYYYFVDQMATEFLGGKLSST
jgi:hypothetical protein